MMGYVPFVMADSLLYDMMKETMSSQEGSERYGMKFVAGRKDIPNAKIDATADLVSKIVKRKNLGETLNLEKELEAIF